ARAAEKLNLSAPALSIQLKQLEESLGHSLFERTRGGLVLTEAGRVALDYAETIGRAGEELMDVMQHRSHGGRQILRVGAVATLFAEFPTSVPQARSQSRRSGMDDMAMLRLFAREGKALALVPPVVVRDEIDSGELVETHRIPQPKETFYAITQSRRIP